MARSSAASRLRRAIESLPPSRHPKRNRPTAARLAPDWLWHELLVSAATLGGSAGARSLLDSPENLSDLSFAKLVALSPARRQTHIGKVLRRAGIRYPAR